MNKNSILSILFLIVALASGFDLVADFSHGADQAHILKEGLLVILSLLAAGWLLFELKQRLHRISNLKQELQTARELSQQQDEALLSGKKQLSQLIHQQFSDWKLSSSEAEIGLLLLKGLSLKEIAGLRNTNEKTVRQQASAIYKKASLPGRHAFSAWFIEDIL